MVSKNSTVENSFSTLITLMRYTLINCTFFHWLVLSSTFHPFGTEITRELRHEKWHNKQHKSRVLRPSARQESEVKSLLLSLNMQLSRSEITLLQV